MTSSIPEADPAGAHGTARAPQRYGVFLNVENPGGDAGEALGQMVRTAVAAEALGFDDVWVAEQHYSRFAIGSALTVLLGHLAACTSRVRLGTGASLLPLNDPVRVAEDIATLDLLSRGRIEFGVARGGPFPVQYRHAGLTSAEAARERMHEALALIRRLWSEPATRFEGRFYRCDDLAIEPRPLQLRAGEKRDAQVCVAQVSVVQVGSSEIGAAQVRAPERRAAEVQVHQLGPL